MTREERPRRNPIPVLPLLLIAIGVLVLIVNLGVVSWAAVLDLWTLWPLLLIAIGVDLITRGRLRLFVVAAVLVLGALAWNGTLRVPGVALGPALPADVHRISHPLAGADRAEVLLSPGVAELIIGSEAGADTVISGEIRTGRGERLVEEASVSGGSAVVELRSENDRAFSGFNRSQRRWELELNDQVPLDLTLDSGVGRNQFDLRGLTLTSLRIDGGVGEVSVTLPETGGYSGRLNLGVGATTIRIPEGVAAAIQVDTGIGAVNVRGDFVRAGDRYLSPDFETATERIELDVDGGVGAITVEAIR